MEQLNGRCHGRRLADDDGDFAPEIEAERRQREATDDHCLVVDEHDLSVRLQIAEDGSLRGFVGGYHAWFPFYWQYGSEGWGVDATNNIDLPGFYYALKNAADADPDPKTGENRMISSTWLLEAVPAFVTHAADRRAELAPTMEGPARGK